MAELGSSASCGAIGLGGLAIASCIPAIDISAVVCAFAGALVFVVWVKEIGPLQRIGYMLAGWLGGYYASAEILAQEWTKTSGIAAFACGLIIVILSISILDALKTGSLPKWLTEIPAAIGRIKKGE